MASKVHRRRFLRSAGVKIAAGAAATATVAVLASDEPPDSAPIPVPDAPTKPAATSGAASSACCGPASKLIFACSGSADVGKIADLAARKLTEDGVGKMFCLAGVGGRVKGIMDATKAAKAILAIDGCPLHCARSTLEQAGFKSYQHLCLSDMGMAKGKTPATEKAVAKVVSLAKARLAG